MPRPTYHPPYVHQDYPKWIDLPDGSRVIAQDEADEARMIAEATPVDNVTEIRRGRPRRTAQ